MFDTKMGKIKGGTNLQQSRKCVILYFFKRLKNEYYERNRLQSHSINFF